MKSFVHILATFIIISSMGILISAMTIPRYTGIDVCRKCHESNAIGNQYAVWAASPHANAYRILSSTKANDIAVKHSIENPSLDRRCLKCHTTGGGKIEKTAKEGVGCEACHGPGGDYYEFSNHASFTNRDAAYRKAVKLGMYPIIGIDGIKAREKLCRHCHHENRPCYPKDPAEQERQKLPLQLIADFIFKHPVRR